MYLSAAVGKRQIDVIGFAYVCTLCTFWICPDTVYDLLLYVCAASLVCLWVWVYTLGAGISTQNHVRAVTSSAEIGLVSPVIRRRGERGKRRKLEERKRLFHRRRLPLHLHHNFILNSRHWMHNRTAMPLWSLLKLMEYLYADCGTLNFLSFPNSVHSPPYTFLPSPVLELPLLGFDTIFTPPRALYFHRLWSLWRDRVMLSSFWSGAISFIALIHIEINAKGGTTEDVTSEFINCVERLN